MIPTEIIDRYDVILFKLGFILRCEPNPGTSYHHLRWMLNELRTMTDVGKANRWLGFIQGVMVKNGHITVQEERDFTRPFFQKEKQRLIGVLLVLFVMVMFPATLLLALAAGTIFAIQLFKRIFK